MLKPYVKLYKSDGNGRIVSYWEAWSTGGKIIVHWGALGTEGRTREIALSPAQRQRPESVIAKESQVPRGEGYREIGTEEMFQIVIQFRIDGMGAPEDLDKRMDIEKAMNQCLGWAGLGKCDGGDMGSGTMNIFCFVVDSGKALPLMLSELKTMDFLDHATLALISDDHAEVAWPKNFQGAFEI